MSASRTYQTNIGPEHGVSIGVMNSHDFVARWRRADWSEGSLV
jgi:hypothetical protein